MTYQPHNTQQPDPHEADIARALSALRSAQPPTGMESRILSRLAEPQPASVFSAAFLRGALTGALVATAACVALFFSLRTGHSTTSQTSVITHPAPIATPVALHTGDQCSGAPSIRDRKSADGWDEKSSLRTPHPISAWLGSSTNGARVPHSSQPYRDEWEGRSSHHPNLIPASFAPSHPAPPAPPTAQERALIQFVRTATPAQLAALSRSSEPKSDAEREAAFNKFFAPSPEVLAIDEAQKKALGLTDDEPAAPKSSKEGQL